MSALDRQRVEMERIKLEEQIQEVRGHTVICNTTLCLNKTITSEKFILAILE